MTTMTEKLLAKAAEYEQKAAALRFAAGEMNGDATVTKQKTAAGTLEAAIALRKAQSNGHSNGHKAGRAAPVNVSIPERQATIRAFLRGAEGPQPAAAVREALTAHGQACSVSQALKVMRAMSDVHLEGYGSQSRWALGAAKAKREGRHTKVAKQATRARIARTLELYDRTEPRSAVDIAKQLGVSVAQTGLAPLIANRYLAKREGGYIRTAKRYIVDAPPTPADA